VSFEKGTIVQVLQGRKDDHSGVLPRVLQCPEENRRKKGRGRVRRGEYTPGAWQKKLKRRRIYLPNDPHLHRAHWQQEEGKSVSTAVIGGQRELRLSTLEKTFCRKRDMKERVEVA